MTKEEAIQEVINTPIFLRDLVASDPCKQEFIPLALDLGWISLEEDANPHDSLYYGVTTHIVNNSYPGLLDEGIYFTVADVFNSAMKNDREARDNAHFCLYIVSSMEKLTASLGAECSFEKARFLDIDAGYWLRNAVLDELERMWKEGKANESPAV